MECLVDTVCSKGAMKPIGNSSAICARSPSPANRRSQVSSPSRCRRRTKLSITTQSEIGCQTNPHLKLGAPMSNGSESLGRLREPKPVSPHRANWCGKCNQQQTKRIQWSGTKLAGALIMPTERGAPYLNGKAAPRYTCN